MGIGNRQDSCGIELLEKNDYNNHEERFFDIKREWISAKDAANFLSVSENAIRIMVYRGQIKSYKLGRRLRFRVSDCRALFEKRGA